MMKNLLLMVFPLIKAPVAAINRPGTHRCTGPLEEHFVLCHNCNQYEYCVTVWKDAQYLLSGLCLAARVNSLVCVC